MVRKRSYGMEGLGESGWTFARKTIFRKGETFLMKKPVQDAPCLAQKHELGQKMMTTLLDGKVKTVE